MSTLVNYLTEYCQKEVPEAICEIHPVSGGDINQAFRLTTTGTRDYFVKYQRSSRATAMLKTEAAALQILAEARVVRIPEVITCVSLPQDDAILLLEYISPGKATPDQMRQFGRQLARLHHHTNDSYGWEEDNFIGTLPQRNRKATTATTFLQSERLIPQWKMARTKGFFSSNEERAFHRLLNALPDIIPEERPALIHGDLWSGNYLIDRAGQAVLIDPASSYGLREMDIAMSHLFGNFGNPFYEGYQEEWPLTPGYTKREEIYQLYYLLVHVNLFGHGYTPSVQRILASF